MGIEMDEESIDKVKEVAGKYLDRDLQGMAKKAGRMIVVANYVCDLNEVIAKKDENGEFEVARELKNAPDWRLFQELTAQSDVIITGSAYFKRFAKKGEAAENVLNQFSKGGQFEDLGDIREERKLKRNPDIAVVARNLNFDIPEAALKDGRRVFVFTTYAAHSSPDAKRLIRSGKGVHIIGAGVSGVDGKTMTEFLASKMGYRVAKMVTGPRVLKILLDAKVLDELYITQVQREITAKPEDIQTILSEGRVERLPGFELVGSFSQDGVRAHDGEVVSQKFFIYDNIEFSKLLHK
ncbi:MAG TPA: hypothetical protein VJ227_02685 [Patescibacteria group bacterium]|nr:hypothetical protein [Patescibacteria group bacterium]